VVAQHRDIHDPELGGSYTVKVYYSAKIEGTHSRVVLKPDSDDGAFEAIDIYAAQSDGLRVVAELMAVLG